MRVLVGLLESGDKAAGYGGAGTGPLGFCGLGRKSEVRCLRIPLSKDHTLLAEC